MTAQLDTVAVPELHRRQSTLVTDDGVPIMMRYRGPDHPSRIVIMSHGYCLRSNTWSRHIRSLADSHPDTAFVTFDQRGHGNSGPCPAGSCTITQLGIDLAALIDHLPAVPKILVGHSMGGMGVLSYLRHNPDTVANRVAGVVLVSTAAQGLSRSGIGAPFNSIALGALQAALAVAPNLTNHVKDWALTVLRPMLHATQHHPVLREYRPAECLESTSVATIAGFLRSLTYHDQTAALPLLRRVHTEIVCGECDIATPLRNSEAIARVSGGRLTALPNVGHLAHLEEPPAVTDAIARALSATFGNGPTYSNALAAAR